MHFLRYKIQKRYIFIDKSILFKENNQTLSFTKTNYETNNQQMSWHASYPVGLKTLSIFGTEKGVDILSHFIFINLLFFRKGRVLEDICTKNY
jgi:hypothetical protein